MTNDVTLPASPRLSRSRGLLVAGLLSTAAPIAAFAALAAPAFGSAPVVSHTSVAHAAAQVSDGDDPCHIAQASGGLHALKVPNCAGD